jgi:hypothetical protein
MLRPGLLLLILLCASCQQEKPMDPDEQPYPFAARTMRVHPVFSQVKDFNDDGKADGIEALIEFQDQFGDPTKAMGKALFELFDYRRDKPDPRGTRVGGPWIVSIGSVAQQEKHWSRTSRTYSFQLSYPSISTSQNYVLTAIFEPAEGGRQFDRIILGRQQPQEPASATSQPTTRPTSQP